MDECVFVNNQMHALETTTVACHLYRGCDASFRYPDLQGSRMFDHDLLGKDDLIGKVKIAVGDIVKGDWIDWFTLKDDDGDQVRAQQCSGRYSCI